MKTFILATVAAVSVAYNHGFPNDSAFHAGCHVDAVLTGTQCTDAVAKATQLITDNVDTDSQYKGQMSMHDSGADWIYSKRKTYNGKYTDDQLFEFSTDGANCNVAARSYSESMSYLDNNVNFCNLWNVLSRTTGFSSYSASHCSQNDHGPSDPVTTCARY